MFDFSDFEITELPSCALCEKNELPSINGIYFVTSKIDRLLYVGMSRNIKERWKNHHRFDEIRTYPDIRIYWLDGKGISLKETEDHFISALKPPLNETHGVFDQSTLKDGLECYPALINSLVQREMKYLSKLAKWDYKKVDESLAFKKEYQAWIKRECYRPLLRSDCSRAASMTLPKLYDWWHQRTFKQRASNAGMDFCVLGGDWPIQALWCYEIGVKVVPDKPENPLRETSFDMYINFDKYSNEAFFKKDPSLREDSFLGECFE